MPVIIVGADTDIGQHIAAGFDPQQREVRVFVTDIDFGERLKRRGFKVALGDVSDASHVGGASMRAFSAVLVAEAAEDDRERSFAGSVDAVVEAWATALTDASVQRIIWVAPGPSPELPEPLQGSAAEVAAVAIGDRPSAEVVAAVVALDEAASLH